MIKEAILSKHSYAYETTSLVLLQIQLQLLQFQVTRH